MSVTWKPDMSTGLERIDQQHRELISRLNLLNEAIADRKPREELEEMIAFLIRYTLFHFGEEEAEFLRYQCPEAEANIRAHKLFEDRMEEIKQRLNVEGPTPQLAASVNGYLLEWLVNHIQNIDRALYQAVKSKQP